MRLGRIRDALAIDTPADADARELRAARLEVARRQPNWTEVAPPVERGRYLVDAETDELFKRHRGAVFEAGSSRILADLTRLLFYVDDDEDVVFLERVPGRTWTELKAREHARGREVRA